MSEKTSLIEELTRKPKRKKRSFAKKIFDDLTSRPIKKGLDYDMADDEKICVEIIQNNLDFKNSESLEIYNKLQRAVYGNSIEEIKELVDQLGDVIKL